MIFRDSIYNFKKFFQCIDPEISLTHCTEMSAVYQNMLMLMRLTEDNEFDSLLFSHRSAVNPLTFVVSSVAGLNVRYVQPADHLPMLPLHVDPTHNIYLFNYNYPFINLII